ncbi:Fe-S cluster assembly sulfur transfer protein SufU [Deinococcus yavapaiensis]|uniref:Nitrogen fixation NifU-like protein n=1 Tax=Deinococcus yavapaiensis KR-236 TaxID=694435 RepID=A0A318S6I9_9DEIO|nr:SUF system NifU family Fe-S cluster assembly protein [Deinococcus yavapaiensis]PYE54384.1 nitrogen fixation NifU-like protein [Deinococcus yavapaiensis KR-236]
MALEDLYRSVISQHHKHPHGVGRIDDALNASRTNTSCGDSVEVWIKLDADRVADVRFQGKGCAISVASASMMTDALKGKTLAEVRDVARQFKEVVMGEASPTPALGELAALSGVSKLHARRKCALLAWQTLEDALSASL